MEYSETTQEVSSRRYIYFFFIFYYSKLTRNCMKSIQLIPLYDFSALLNIFNARNTKYRSMGITYNNNNNLLKYNKTEN